MKKVGKKIYINRSKNGPFGFEGVGGIKLVVVVGPGMVEHETGATSRPRMLRMIQGAPGQWAASIWMVT